MKPGAPPAAGSGPEAVPTEAATYFDIALENEARERAIRALRPGLPEQPPLAPGEVPRMTGGPWASGDHFGVDAAVDINPADPSGTLKNRGID